MEDYSFDGALTFIVVPKNGITNITCTCLQENELFSTELFVRNELQRRRYTELNERTWVYKV